MIENGSEYLVFIKRAGDDNWKTIACLVANELQIEAETIETSSECDGKYSNHRNSKISFTISAQGYAIDDGLEASQVSHNALFDLSVSGEPFDIKIAKIGSLYARQGRVTIVSYTENQTMNEAFSFSVTFKGKGKINGNFLKYLADNFGKYIVPSTGEKIIVEVHGN
ncbi:hypothetical protein K7A41_01565 [Sphingobacterium sp. InxBP1]|uniref:phage tail tube protein n=1 Tax=Sphingobacterium sp. InxBP1 TaxID=2870328 RepID=UPI002244B70D|nr:phage tail tube protein [Sphingobacterium sp. InxBP1]MCW8309904.1 hypothetical protein [Sphingobacterium sp. InxBP1]